MKNRLIGIVFIFMLLAGCVSQQPNSSSIDTVEKSKMQTLHVENNIYGKSFTAKGNYQLTNILNPDNGNNIVYTDFESKNSIFLCSNLECTHNTEVCESYKTRVSKLYSLNLDTGKTEVNTLQFLPFDERKKITILAEYEDYFLVNNGMETVEFLRQSKREYSKNEIVEDIVEVSINSLILKSDYFTSNENYMNVGNRYLQDCKESVQP